MKIVMNYPPNIEEIKKVATIRKGTIFTYGDTIYSPSTASLPDHLIKHEETHMQQQTNPDEWWQRYLTDVEFRIEQEVEAYHNQYEFYKNEVRDTIKQQQLLMSLAADLSSDMYGGIISFEDAMKRIVEGK